MQHERHHWFRPPPHVNGWGWQTEQRLDELERQAQDLSKHASAIACIEQSLSALSRWSLSDWVLANRRKLLLYGLVALMLTGNLSLAEIKDKIEIKLPFGEGSIAGTLQP